MLAAALDIRRWLEADRETPFAERLARDRAIGRTLGATRGDSARILAWWQRISAGSAEPALAAQPARGMRVESLRRVASVLLVLAGVLLGGGAAAVAFAYDGRHPVNLFRLLGLLVVLPGALLVMTLVLLPWRPATATGAFAALNAGRWTGAALDRLAGIELFAPARGAPLGLAGFARWQMLVFTQWGAVGFFMGALGYSMLLVAFTDLAFGWSTTLDVAAADVHRWFAWLSAPWAGWFPRAAPDQALTEAARYFRGEGAGMGLERAARLGDWWPFVLLTMLVYGLLPRLLMLAVGHWRLRAATRELMLRDPEVTALLDRLGAPIVTPGVSAGVEGPGAPSGELPAPARGAGSQALALVWNGALPAAAASDWLAHALDVQVAAVADFGVLQPEAAQRAALAALARAYRDDPAARRIVVLTRGFEPPLLEFADFLGLLREHFGLEPAITVVPVDVTGTRVEAADRAVWAKTLARLRDPRLYVQEALP